MNTFSIQHQLTLKEYRRICFILLYSKVWVIFISIFSIIYIAGTLILWLTRNYSILSNEYYQYGLVVAIMPIWILLLSFFSIRRNFKSAYRINESTTYDFSDQGYVSKGESFTSKTDWKDVYKVKLIKDWLIVYHNKLVAHMIKVKPTDRDNMEALKAFLKASNFKAKLKW